jgi:cell division protease FtsH
VDRIVAGMEGTPMVDGKSKSLVAYHEVGHAVCATLTPGHDPVQKVCWTWLQSVLLCCQ